MSDLIKRLCRPGYDLQKEQAIQEAIIEIRELRTKIAEMEKQRALTDAAQHIAEVAQNRAKMLVAAGNGRGME